MKNDTSKILGAILSVGISLVIAYAGLMIAKNLSYRWWYEDMVKQTIREVVSAQAIKR
jgi:hypothetical protein